MINTQHIATNISTHNHITNNTYDVKYLNKPIYINKWTLIISAIIVCFPIAIVFIEWLMKDMLSVNSVAKKHGAILKRFNPPVTDKTSIGFVYVLIFYLLSFYVLLTTIMYTKIWTNITHTNVEAKHMRTLFIIYHSIVLVAALMIIALMILMYMRNSNTKSVILNKFIFWVSLMLYIFVGASLMLLTGMIVYLQNIRKKSNSLNIN